jgi:hypothetical protein
MSQNERYLLCLGVCNTLFDTPHVKSDMVLALIAARCKKSTRPMAGRYSGRTDLPGAIPLGESHVLLPRPHLQELIAYIQQHPNLDVAIISGATREYIDNSWGWLHQSCWNVPVHMVARRQTQLLQTRSWQNIQNTGTHPGAERLQSRQDIDGRTRRCVPD